jgi:hypothetical protein
VVVSGPRIPSCTPSHDVITQLSVDAWQKSQGTSTYTDSNRGSGKAPESLSWSSGIDVSYSLTNNSGWSEGINPWVVSVSHESGTSVQSGIDTDQDITIIDTVETPSGDTAYFQVGTHSKYAQGYVQQIAQNCGVTDLGGWWGYWPEYSYGICGWITGQSSFVCSTAKLG